VPEFGLREQISNGEDWGSQKKNDLHRTAPAYHSTEPWAITSLPAFEPLRFTSKNEELLTPFAQRWASF
jgi:hypothetical protein